MKKILLIVLAILSSSCKSQNDFSKAKNCINGKFYTSKFLINDSRKVDFFDLILSMENELIKYKFLENNNKYSYKELIFDLDKINKKFIKNKFENILKKNGVYNLEGPHDLIFNCIRYYETDSNEITKSMKNQIDEFDKVFAENNNFDSEALYNLIKDVKEEEFKDIVYRSALIILIYNKMIKE